MPFKIQFFFHSDVQGWREVYYASPALLTPRGYMPYCEEMALRRLRLCAKGVWLSHITVHDELVRRSGETSTAYSGTAYGAASLLPRDTIDNGWKVRMRDATETYRRSLFLRGLPDQWTSWFNTNVALDPGLLEAFNGFKAAILASDPGKLVVPGIGAIPWQIKVINRTPVPGVPLAKTVSDVRPDAASGLTRVQCVGHGFPPGQSIRISKCKFSGPRPPKVNGVWTVIPWAGANFPPADNFLIGLDADTADAYHLDDFGEARARNYIYLDIADMNLQRPASHKTGKARLTRRGRRTNRT